MTTSQNSDLDREERLAQLQNPAFLHQLSCHFQKATKTAAIRAHLTGLSSLVVTKSFVEETPKELEMLESALNRPDLNRFEQTADRSPGAKKTSPA